MRYEVITPGRVVVGPGSSADLPNLTAGVGSAALLVHSRGAVRRGGPAADVIAALSRRGLVAAVFAVSGEPDVATVEAGALLAREFGCDCVVGIGGGSVLDTAKGAAALAANPGGALTYMEVVGAGRALAAPALPIVAVPTTAGAGSEATRNTSLIVPASRAKASIRHDSLMPRLALVDPQLTHDLPADVTAACGMDALTQLLEPLVGRRRSPFVEALCAQALPGLVPALRRAASDPDDGEARARLSQAALFSGMALTNAGLGAVHGIAAAVGGAFPAPHGAVCAALLPHVTAANIAALERAGRHEALSLYRAAARLILGGGDAGPEALAGHLHALARDLGIPALGAYGITPGDVPALAAAAAQASSTKNNPVELTVEELAGCIAAAV